MEKNPLEQQEIKINALKKETREKFGDFFDNREEFNSKIEIFILQLETFEKEGLVFSKDEIIKGLREGVTIQDREKFIVHYLKVLEPLMMLKVFTQPKIFEKLEREIEVNSGIKLSEVLSAEFKDEEEMVKIHLAPATELIKGEGIGYFKKEVEIGLRKLAEEIKSNDKIKKVLAESWIVAKNPSLLERLGFTYDGMVPEEENDAGYIDDLGNKRPFARAFMTRKDFLAKYGN